MFNIQPFQVYALKYNLMLNARVIVHTARAGGCSNTKCGQRWHYSVRQSTVGAAMV